MHELQHGAARGKQTRVRCTGDSSGPTFKQHVEFITQGTLVTVRAEPLRPRDAFIALRRNRQLMAPQPELDNLVRLPNCERQAEKWVM